MKRFMIVPGWAKIEETKAYLYKLVHVPRKLAEFNRQLKTAVKKAVREGKDLHEVMEYDGVIGKFMKALTREFGPRYIARGAHAKNPWGCPLRAVRAELEIHYLPLEFQKDAHTRLLTLEASLKSLQKELFEERKAT
jgi:hypothetical protein